MMATEQKLHDPWLVAVWPGMGGVAITAGYYLMAKLGMHLLLEFSATDFFDVEQVEVQDGLILTRRLPRSRMFLWNDPQQQRDLIVFIGEAQPPARGSAFCRNLIEQAKILGVRRVYTFAAMATAMRPKDDSRVFGADIDRKTLAEFTELDVDILETVEQTLDDFLLHMEDAMQQAQPDKLPEPAQSSSTPGADSASRQRIEKMFTAARQDRSRAYELKQELDRLGLFNEFEDRFLDLFKDPQ